MDHLVGHNPIVFQSIDFRPSSHGDGDESTTFRVGDSMTYFVPAASSDAKGKLGDGKTAVVMVNCDGSGLDPFQQLLG